MNFVERIWHSVSAQNKSITEEDTIEQIKLLIGFLIGFNFFILTGPLILMAPALVFPDKYQVTEREVYSLLLSVLLAIINVGLIFIAKTKRYKISAFFLGFLFNIFVVLYVVLGTQTEDDRKFLNFFSVGILAVSIFFSVRSTIKFALLFLLILLSLPLYHPVFTIRDVIGSPLMFNVAIVTFILIFAKHRDQLEKIRHNKLKATMQKEIDMIDILGHELRTPLSTIRNTVYKLDTVVKGEEISRKKLSTYVSLLGRNVNREIKLLETLITTTSIDKNSLNLQKEEINITEIIKDSIQTQIDLVNEKGLKIIFEQEEVIILYSDRIRVQEVINNILSNAVKYTNEGKIEIRVKELRSSIEIEISDTGIGIPKDEIPLIKEKFYRVNSHIGSERSKAMSIVRPGGTGLGLYVVYKLINALDGRVDVTSKVGEGSTFKITLPR